jgi:hypothetical protein
MTSLPSKHILSPSAPATGGYRGGCVIGPNGELVWLP